MSMPSFKSSRLASPTGADLQVYSCKPGKNQKAVIHVNHGMAEHAKRYERFAMALAEAGYGTYAHDHRGHGYTEAENAPLGSFAKQEGLVKVLADSRAVNQHIRKKHPGRPVVYFGHSMGSIIGLNYCIRHSDTINAAALWNSGVDAGFLLFVFTTLLKLERMFKGSDVASMIALKLTFEDWNNKFKPVRTEFDWLSRDNTEVDKYVADPLCGFPTSVGLWLDVMKAIRTGADDRNLAAIKKDLPMFLLGGGADPCSSHGTAMQRLAQRLGSSGIRDIKLEILPQTRHESLNEINRDETTTKFIGWLDERFGK